LKNNIERLMIFKGNTSDWQEKIKIQLLWYWVKTKVKNSINIKKRIQVYYIVWLVVKICWKSRDKIPLFKGILIVRSLKKWHCLIQKVILFVNLMIFCLKFIQHFPPGIPFSKLNEKKVYSIIDCFITSS
jgi:hypothetical protein